MKPDTASFNLNLGFSIGLFTVASLILDGYQITPEIAEALKRNAAGNVEEACGMPSEDFAALAYSKLEEIKTELKMEGGP